MAAPPGHTPVPKPAATGVAPGGGASTHSTQIFGGGRSAMTSTQLFGSGPHPNPLAGSSTPVPNTTQAFGAVPPPPAVPPVGATQTFGAVPPQGTSAPGNATQAFGAVPAVAPGHATQTFGAVPAVAPVQAKQPSGPVSTTAPGNMTQTFGAVPAVAPVQAKQPAGSVPATAPGNATQVFGAVPAVAPGNATQAFGAVPAVPPVQAKQPSGPVSTTAPGNMTQTFGAVPAVAPGNTTQVFGAVSAPPGLASRGNPTSTAGQVPARTSTSPGNTTQVFGAVPSNDAPAPLGRSQAFSAVPAQPGATPPPSGSGPVGSTQVYGAVDPVAPGPESSQGPVIGSTALFGATATSPSQDTGIRLPPESDAPVGNDTLVPFGPSSLRQGAVEPVPGPATSARRAPVALPPELLAASRMPSAGGELVMDSGPRRDRLLVVLAVLAGLGLTGVLAYPAWRDRDADMPAVAVEDRDRAEVLLRRDDQTSREQAIQGLRKLTGEHPKYVEAQAELVVALSLQLSDLQAESERLRLRSNKLLQALGEARQDDDLAEREIRVANIQKDVEEVAAEMAPLKDASDSLRKELDSRVTALASAPEVEPAQALVARVKARAVHAGVTLAPDALALAERLRNVDSASSPWSLLARAEYALSSGSPPESLAAVAGELEALRQKDSTLLRAYVLGARMALRLDDPETARSLLNDVLTLNPNHQLAKRLHAQLDARSDSP